MPIATVVTNNQQKYFQQHFEKYERRWGTTDKTEYKDYVSGSDRALPYANEPSIKITQKSDQFPTKTKWSTAPKF